MVITNVGKGQLLYKKAKKIIPGGTQLLSKRPEMFLPEYWPVYYSKAKGCKIWDLDGNEYTDVSYMGVGANVLGYANDEVDAAAKEAIDNGGMSTLNAPEEVYVAEKLIELHPWAGGVRIITYLHPTVCIACSPCSFVKPCKICESRRRSNGFSIKNC